VFVPSEQLGKTEEDRKAIFDAYCIAETGDVCETTGLSLNQVRRVKQLNQV
jgi:hypothetical protein